MGMLITGLNKFRDFWDTLNNALEAGSGTTQYARTDTDLETPVAGTEYDADTSSKVDQALLKQATIPGVAGDDSSLSEFIWKTKSPEKAGSRIVLASGITWSSAYDIEVDTEYYWQGGQS